MASSAFATNSLSKVYRWRAKAGRSLSVYNVPMTNSAVYRKGDILSIDANGQCARSVAVSGTAGFTSSGGAKAPKYIALETKTGGTGLGNKDTIACLDIEDVELLMRIYHTTPASSEQAAVDFGEAYRFGIYQPDTTSTNYYPCLDALNVQTNGEFKITEFAIESEVNDDYGLVWVKATGN